VWNVDVLDCAHQEAIAFLSEEQHACLRELVKELARWPEPSNQPLIDVRRVADVFEIRDKGGLLGKINVRIFFCIDHDTRTIAVLSVINKKNDGPTPKVDKIRATSRRRRYLEQYSGES